MELIRDIEETSDFESLQVCEAFRLLGLSFFACHQDVDALIADFLTTSQHQLLQFRTG